MEFKNNGSMIYLGDETNPDAYLEFNKREVEGYTVLNCTHTVVNPSLGGQGIGTKLAEEFFKYARENGFKVTSSCSFTRKKLDEGDYSDIRA